MSAPAGYRVALDFTVATATAAGYAVALEFEPDDPGTPTSTIYVGGTFGDTQLFGGTLAVQYIEHATLTAGGTLPVSAAFGGAITLAYDSRVARPEARQAASAFQQAAGLGVLSHHLFADTSRTGCHLRDTAQQAARIAAEAAGAFETAARLSASVISRAQQAARLAAGTISGFETGAPLRHNLTDRAQQAEHAATTPARYAWQIAAPLRREFASPFEQAGVNRTMRLRAIPELPLPPGYAVRLEFALQLQQPRDWAELQGGPLISGRQNGLALRLHLQLIAGYQDAKRPPPSATKPPPPGGGGGEEPEPPKEPIVIPTLRCYVVHNNVTLYRLPAGVEFKASTFSLDIDTDSWTFSWSASLHSSARAHLLRSDPSERVHVQAVVNGINLHLVIDSIARSRSFPEDRIQVSGRGRAAELGDTALSFGNTAARTAQQLMQDVLTVNGVPLGWDLDWQIEDWLVPADAWLFQGSYIAALQDIAGAVGAYVQPHFTDQVLRVLPRYPLAPWHWAADLDPDIILPVAATSVEGVEEVIRPDYNQVHVGGLKAPAVFGPVKRAGSAGDIEPEPVLHALITASEAHRQRGLAVLADTGLQEHVTLQTLLLPETGIIMPGTVVSYISDDKARKGIVRKTSLQMQSWPVLRQEIGVETHVID